MKIPKRKTLQNFQDSLAPSREFRENLKSRLEAIYTIEHGQDPSPFGFFRYTSIFASLIVFVGIGYVVLDTGTQIEESIIQTHPSIEEAKIILPLQQESETYKNTEDRISSTASVLQNPSSIDKKEVTSSLSSRKTQEIAPLSSDGQKNVEVIQKDKTDFTEEQRENFSDFSEAAPLPQADTNMMESRSYIPSFLEICTQYNGVVGETEGECVLENGKICTIENIDTCTLSSSGAIHLGSGQTDIFLQELIDELGQ